MAETKAVMSFITTTANRLPELPIKNGNLIFIPDKQRVAFDYGDKRTFYNQIVVLNIDTDRTGILAPIPELFYFVIETGRLWTYTTEWVPVTSPPEEQVVFGDTLPAEGKEGKLYVDANNRNISIWRQDQKGYIEIAGAIKDITTEDINGLFTGSAS